MWIFGIVKRKRSKRVSWWGDVSSFEGLWTDFQIWYIRWKHMTPRVHIRCHFGYIFVQSKKTLILLIYLAGQFMESVIVWRFMDQFSNMICQMIAYDLLSSYQVTPKKYFKKYNPWIDLLSKSTISMFFFLDWTKI